MVKNLPGMWEIWVRFLGREDPVEKKMATHSRILAWRIPWTEEPSGLESMATQRVSHDWAANTSLYFTSIKKCLGGKQWSFILFYCGNLLNGCSYRSVLAVSDTIGCVNLDTCLAYAKEKESGILSGMVSVNWRTYKKLAYNFLDSCIKFCCITFASYRMKTWYFCC